MTVFKQTAKPSVVVSLGIGADIRAEEKLKEVLPKDTEFFGADPVMIPNAELFSKVGKFFPFAISADNGLHKAQIRLDNGSYGIVTVEHIKVLDFFLIMLERDFIDHVIMDNEGPEYDFIPMIAINNVFVKNACENTFAKNVKATNDGRKSTDRMKVPGTIKKAATDDLNKYV
uniref:Methyltransf_21 domain-containing protein n=1 Tax=Angiostrongylus cantonensis TaxID=6313 RepID=A0A0K0D0Y1_ANGCA